MTWITEPNKAPSKTELREIIGFAITDGRFEDIITYVNEFQEALIKFENKSGGQNNAN